MIAASSYQPGLHSLVLVAPGPRLHFVQKISLYSQERPRLTSLLQGEGPGASHPQRGLAVPVTGRSSEGGDTDLDLPARLPPARADSCPASPSQTSENNGKWRGLERKTECVCLC